MKFREFNTEDINQASVLLAYRHKKEREVLPTLREEFADSKRTAQMLNDIMEDEECSVKGICAVENDKLIGFLLSIIESDGPFGRCAMVPYECLAIADTQSPELYRKLYAELSKVWLEYGIENHYVFVPAGHEEVVDAWLRLGFAFDQVYGMKNISKENVNVPNDLVIRQADENDGEDLAGVSNLIFSHQAKSPTYAPAVPERIAQLRQGYAELPEEEGSVVLLAYKNDKLLGFQLGNMYEDEDNMMTPEKAFEISIAGTVEESRGTGVGTILTDLMINRAVEKGFKNAFCDWKIANLSSSNFWPKKGFKPVAYRMFRRIDGRVYWADGIKAL